MKTIILFFLCINMGLSVATAQNRSIHFEEGESWKTVVKKAKKAKKLIFVDCYTSWCGPCKMLAKDIFTKDEVADFFNANFINAKYDMEKDADGVILKKQFAVKAYPTLVFIDPVSGEILHRMVGGGNVAWLLAGAKAALQPDDNLSSLTKRYAAGERTPDLMRKYASALYSSYQREESARIACEYLDSLPVDSLGTPDNWQLITRCVHDPLCPLLRRVMAERRQLYPLVGREKVDKKLTKSILDAAIDLAEWQPKKKGVFDEKRNEQLLTYLQTLDFVAAPAGLAYLYTAAYTRQGDFRGLMDKMREVLGYNLFREGTEIPYFKTNIRMLALSKDKSLVEEGIQWIEQKCMQPYTFIEKANLMRCQQRLWASIGNQEESQKAKQKAEEYMREHSNQKAGN